MCDSLRSGFLHSSYPFTSRKIVDSPPFVHAACGDKTVLKLSQEDKIASCVSHLKTKENSRSQQPYPTKAFSIKLPNIYSILLYTLYTSTHSFILQRKKPKSVLYPDIPSLNGVRAIFYMSFSFTPASFLEVVIFTLSVCFLLGIYPKKVLHTFEKKKKGPS